LRRLVSSYPSISTGKLISVQLDKVVNPGLSKEQMKAAKQRERERQRRKKAKKKAKRQEDDS